MKRALANGSAPVKRALAIGLGASIGVAIVVGLHGPASAELENQVFTAKAEKLRIVVPRGWRATDQPSYPGLLLWMMRSEPEGKIVLTDEAFTRDVYCSWPVRCQMSRDALPAKLACALGAKLGAKGLHVGPAQAGPKENEEAGMPSVWFEYDDGKTFLRQAVAIDEDHVVSLVLSAPSSEARNSHVRAFEQALRTLRPLNQAEIATMAGSAVGSAVVPAGSGSSATPAGSGGGAPAVQAGSGAPAQRSGAPASGSAAGSASAIAARSTSGAAGSASGSAAGTTSGSAGSAAGSATGSAGSDTIAPPTAEATARSTMFMSTPAPRIDPIGPCTRK